MAIVRVKDADGHEYSIGEDHAAAVGLTVIDKPAVDAYGAALPPKRFRSLADLNSRTVSELRELAADEGVDLGDAEKKQQILAALTADNPKEK